MCPALRKRNMRHVDKEKHVTRVSADVASTYERNGNYIDVTSGYERVTCFSLSTSHTLRLCTSRHIFCSEFGTPFDSIMSALWDQPIVPLLIVHRMLFKSEFGMN